MLQIHTDTFICLVMFNVVIVITVKVYFGYDSNTFDVAGEGGGCGSPNPFPLKDLKYK